MGYPPTLAFAVAGDDVPPDALKALVVNAAPLQLASCFILVGCNPGAAFDSGGWCCQLPCGSALGVCLVLSRFVPRPSLRLASGMAVVPGLI